MSMNNKEYKEKQSEMYENHPDRLFEYEQNSTCNIIERVEAMVKEAGSKGYTILPADGTTNGDGKLMQGIVLFKEIDGIELSYNPRWILGSLGVDTKTLLGIKDKTRDDFWMEDVGDIALKATELIETELAKYGIKLDPDKKEDDLFYVPIFNVLENFSNGNYRRHM